MIGLLEGHLSEEQISSFSRDYGFSFDHAFYSAGILVQEKSSDQPLDPGLLSVSLINLVRDRLAAFPGYTCLNYLGTIVVIAGFKHNGEQRQFV